MKRVLIACEYSGRVREAFKKRGWDAWSCDLLPTEIPGQHHKGDIFQFLKKDSNWDLLIGFPECTYVCGSGMHWTTRGLRDPQLTEDAISFFRKLWSLPIKCIALENPVGVLSSRVCKPSQTIQPYHFGEDASKKTCLWLKNLPPLCKTRFIEPRWVDGKPRWGNQTDSGQNKLGPTKDKKQRGLDRAKTYQGIADAMADQWTNYLCR